MQIFGGQSGIGCTSNSERSADLKKSRWKTAKKFSGKSDFREDISGNLESKKCKRIIPIHIGHVCPSGKVHCVKEDAD